jgi:hypothetical protein
MNEHHLEVGEIWNCISITLSSWGYHWKYAIYEDLIPALGGEKDHVKMPCIK